MIDKNLFIEIRKFIVFAFIIYLLNYLIASYFHENLINEVHVIQVFCVLLFGGLIFITKVLAKIIPSFIIFILMGFIGFKLIAAALFIFVLSEFSEDNENHIVLVFMTNYFLHLIYSTKKIVGYIQN